MILTFDLLFYYKKEKLRKSERQKGKERKRNSRCERERNVTKLYRTHVKRKILHLLSYLFSKDIAFK